MATTNSLTSTVSKKKDDYYYYIPAAEDDEEEKTVGDEEGSIQKCRLLRTHWHPHPFKALSKPF